MLIFIKKSYEKMSRLMLNASIVSKSNILITFIKVWKNDDGYIRKICIDILSAFIFLNMWLTVKVTIKCKEKSMAIFSKTSKN